MEEQKSQTQIRLVLRFTPSGKVYSLITPVNWTIKKLRNFINYTFKEDTKNCQVNLYYGAKLITNENAFLGGILNKNDELSQIIVNLKNKEGVQQKSLPIENSKDSETLKKEIISSDDFDKLELYIYNCYRDVLKSNLPNTQPEKEMMNKLPLMHANIDDRVKIVNEKTKIGMIGNYDPENIENYPARNYVKIEVFFKLFLFFILFGAHIKGYNIPFFISLLVVYYWYCLFTDINEFYQKKVNEHRLTPEELKELKFLELDEEDEEILEREEEKELERLHKRMAEAENERSSRKNTGEKLEKLEKIEKIENLEKEDDIKVENINKMNSEEFTSPLDREHILENPSQNNNKNKFEDEPEDIAHIISKIESKKTKKLEKLNREETPIIYVGKFIIEIIYTFAMSLFPMWCDEFEQHNPVITAEITANNNQIAQNNQDDFNIIYPNGNFNDLNDLNNFNNNNINPDVQSQSQNVSIPHEVEAEGPNNYTSNFKQDNKTEQLSEKILIKSSNDTRLVNPSEGQHVKYFLVEENENKTENEFVFSENVNIDTLSYNEPIIESWKKKQEKEGTEEDSNNHKE